MISYLREKGKSWVLKGVLGFVALTFVSWGGFALTSRRRVVSGGRVALWVNETPVSVREFERRYFLQAEAVRRQVGAAFTEEMAQQLGLRQRTLNGLVFEKLQLEEAERLGIRITDEELALRIQELPDFQRAGKFDPAVYRRVLEANRLSPRDYEREQRRLLTMERLRRYIGMAAWVSRAELRERYRLLRERVRVDAIHLEPSRFAPKIEAPDKELEEFYEKRKEEFRVGARVKAAWWHLPFEAVASRVKMSEEDLRARFEETRSRYILKDKVTASQILLKLPADAPADKWEEARRTLEGLRARIQGGEDFAAMARKNSQGPAAAKGGGLGSFERGQLVPEIEKAVFSLKAGEVSEPIRTSFGLHLLLVRERQGAGRLSFEKARPEVEKDLRERKARELALRALRSVRYAIEDKKAPPPVEGLRSGQTRLFERGSPPATAPEGGTLASLAFGLKKKNAFSSEEAGEKGAMFVRLLETRASVVPPFQEVKGKVRKRFLEDKGAARLARLSQEWLGKLRAGRMLFAGLAIEQDVKLLKPDAFTRNDELRLLGGSRQVAEAAFSLKNRGDYARVLVGRDVYLLRLEEPPSLDMAAFAQEEKRLRSSLLERKRTIIFLRQMEEIRQAAKVRMDPDFTL
ncbi:MAG: SurA N-terminal domain-containing protein [bacterium]